jgi:glycosyltransferase involved in cell wall biosynthesis
LNFVEFKGHKFNSISLDNTVISAQYDVLVATFYSTLFIVLNYSKAKRKLYLVQGYETDFFSYGNINRGEVEKTYSIPFGVEYITISKWCETWLREKYGQKPLFAPNGIDLNLFVEHKRDLNKTKIRILIEGDNLSPKKNVDESFRIVEKLNKNKYEIWYMSYNGEPKKWYRVDKFLSKIPYQKVRNVYEQCDILIKSSYLESFSYPPLEMMATGGFCIIAPNKGNIEYLKDEENCLFYKLGDIQSAIQRIERLISDVQLQQHLYENGLDTSKKREWKNFKKQILSLYE